MIFPTIIFWAATGLSITATSRGVCQFDGPAQVGHLVILSRTIPGGCHDAGTTDSSKVWDTGNIPLGRVYGDFSRVFPELGKNLYSIDESIWYKPRLKRPIPKELQ